MNTAVSWPVQRPDFFEYFKRRAATKRKHHKRDGQFHRIESVLRDEITSTQETRYPGFSESKVPGYKTYTKRYLGAELDFLH